MDADEFRKHGHRLIDWVAEYLEGAGKYPVLPEMAPGEIREKLPGSAPEEAEEMGRVLEDFETTILPGVTHWNHPRFFAYFPANHSPPAILGELLSAALGVNAMVWQSCPAATELEERVMDWLRELLGLPPAFRGVIQDTASTATLCALLCAREKTTDFGINQSGPSAWATRGPLRVYASTEAHSSVDKAVRIAGFGIDHLVRVGIDGSRAMDPADLEEKINADLEAGHTPCCVVATVGTTSSTAVDPLGPVGAVAARYGLWLHADAALAGSAAILPEMRWLLDGVEHCHSFVFNPHKWLFTNFDCSAFYCRAPDLLERTFSVDPAYLQTDRDRQVNNYRDWGIQLGRRFRALKLWFVLRAYGAEKLREMLRAHLDLANQFKEWVQQGPGFELMAPVPLQTVCFRHRPQGMSDERELARHNKAVMDRANRTGRIFITHTELDGRFCLRLSIGQLATKLDHVEEAWRVIREAAREVSC